MGWYCAVGMRVGWKGAVSLRVLRANRDSATRSELDFDPGASLTLTLTLTLTLHPLPSMSYVVPTGLLEEVVPGQRRAQVLPIRERAEVCTGGVREGCTGAPYKRERGGVQGEKGRKRGSGGVGGGWVGR